MRIGGKLGLASVAAKKVLVSPEVQPSVASGRYLHSAYRIRLAANSRAVLGILIAPGMSSVVFAHRVGIHHRSLGAAFKEPADDAGRRYRARGDRYRQVTAVLHASVHRK